MFEFFLKLLKMYEKIQVIGFLVVGWWLKEWVMWVYI